MFRQNSYVKYIIIIRYVIISMLLFLWTDVVWAIPSCAFKKLSIDPEKIISFVTVDMMDNPSVGPSSEVYFIDTAGETLESAGRILAFDYKCNLIYQEKLYVHPLSIFILDDGISGIIFNLMETADGAYPVAAYHLGEHKKVIKVLNEDEARSYPIPPEFIIKPGSPGHAINIYRANCSSCLPIKRITYRFDKKSKQYIKLESK